MSISRLLFVATLGILAGIRKAPARRSRACTEPATEDPTTAENDGVVAALRLLLHDVERMETRIRDARRWTAASPPDAAYPGTDFLPVLSAWADDRP
jgi:hypothetical protein